MNLSRPIRPVLLFATLSLTFLSPAFAMDGVRAGDCWTDYDGTNHCGDSSSSSSTGYVYTYGYTNGTQSSGPSWADRAEARRLQQEANALAAVQQEAVRLNQIGIDYANKGDWQNALSYYEQAHATNPSDPVIANNVQMARGTGFNEAGIAAYTREDYAAAVEAYQQALNLKPDSQVIRDNLADAQNQLQIKESQAAAERKNQEDLAQAGQKMKEGLSGFSLSAPQNTAQTAPASGLSFKGAAAENKPSAWDQLKNAWTKGKEAKSGVTDEDASMKAREGVDTSKNRQTNAAVDSSVVDLRDKSGVVNTDVLRFKPAASTTESDAVKARTLPASADNDDLIELLTNQNIQPVPVKEPQSDMVKARTLPASADNEDLIELLTNQNIQPVPVEPKKDTFMEILDEEFKQSQKEKK